MGGGSNDVHRPRAKKKVNPALIQGLFPPLLRVNQWNGMEECAYTVRYKINIDVQEF